MRMKHGLMIYMIILLWSFSYRSHAFAYEGNIQKDQSVKSKVRFDAVKVIPLETRIALEKNALQIDASGFPEIVVYFSPLDAMDDPILDLVQADLSLSEKAENEDGAQMEDLTCFIPPSAGNNTMLSFALVFDLSSSIEDARLGNAQTAAVNFIENVSQNSMGSVCVFAGSGEEAVLFPATQVEKDANANGIKDIVEAVNALRQRSPSHTALYDGIALGIESIAHLPGPRAVIVFTDGDTNDDRSYDINQATAKALQNGTAIFTIGKIKTGEQVLNLVNATGGRAYVDLTQTEMAEMFGGILKNSGNQYTLCYQTHNTAMDGTLREVTLSDPRVSGMGTYVAPVSGETQSGLAPGFNWAPASPAVGEPVQFTDVSTSATSTIVAWSWLFDGEGTSALQHPVVTFSEEGVYPITLTVTDQAGNAQTIAQTITIAGCSGGDCEANGGCFITAVSDKGGSLFGWILVAILGGIGGLLAVRRSGMGKCLGIGIAILLVGYVMPHTVSAQNKAGKIQISPMLGAVVFDDDQNIDKSLAGGLGVGYNFDEHLGAELFLDYSRSDFHYYNPATCSCAKDPVNAFMIHLDGLYHFFPKKTLVPYLAAGIGMTALDFDESDNYDSLMADWGGGLKYFLSEDVALRADVRHVINFDESYQNVLGLVGFTFQFPKDEKKMAPVAEPVPMPAPELPKVVTQEIYGITETSAKAGGNVLADGGAAITARGFLLGKTPELTPSDQAFKDSETRIGVFNTEFQNLAPDTVYYAKAYATNEAGTAFGAIKSFKTQEMPPPPVEPIILPTNLVYEFEFDRTHVIAPPKKEDLDTFIAFLGEHPESMIVIEGYTCNMGTDQYNIRLAKERALEILKELKASGLNPEFDDHRIAIIPYGKQHPAFDNTTEDGRRRNRRVVVRIRLEE